MSRCTKGVLKNPSDWAQPWEMSFSLDTKSRQFKEELGDQWSNVTWRVKVPEKVPLWVLMVKDWEQYKRESCMGNERVGTKWWEIEDRLFPRQYPRPRLELVENGDGHTYLGKVKRF